MKRIIERPHWRREDNFSFFETFINPCITITSEVECSAARAKARLRGQSFFIYYLYAILRATNEIEELRYRLDREGRILVFDTVDVLTPIRVADDGRFVSVRIPWAADFDTFYKQASEIIGCVSSEVDPYEYAKQELKVEDDRYNLILISATPDLHFTSITHTQELKTGSDYPLLNVGKAIAREGKLFMPVAIYVHHGFVDGKHLADFYRIAEEVLNLI